MQTTSSSIKGFTVLVALLVGVSVIAVVMFAHKNNDDQALGQQSIIPKINLVDFSHALADNDQVLLLDVRPKTDYTTEHIPNSVSIPAYELDITMNDLELFDGWQLVVICATDDCSELSDSYMQLEEVGFSSIAALEGGFSAYKSAQLSTASQAQLVQDDLASLLGSLEVPEISVDDMIQKIESPDIVIVDGRTSFEFVTGFIPGAINIPLHTIGAAIEQGFIPKDKTIILYDRVGNRAKIGVEALKDAGYESVFNLSGGIEGWQAAEQPVQLPAEDGSDLPELIPVLYPDQNQ